MHFSSLLIAAEKADIESRFWTKVQKRGPEDCWEWRASRNSHGYGILMVNQKSALAHRVSYALKHGPLALTEGLFVCHKCDNRKCVNPGHLELGTQFENIRQCIERRRNPHGEKNKSAKLTEDAVRDIRSQPLTLEHICAMMLKYRVGENCVRVVHARKMWKHVT